jgi:putative RNA 2'-phosphotransferase
MKERLNHLEKNSNKEIMNKHLKSTSKFISLVLRHKPEEIGLQLDENGWADVHELLDKMKATSPGISFGVLKEIVETNDKKRFAFNEDETKIRANQGHSIDVDLELEPVTPPDVLYHGTAEKNVAAIMQTGLHKMRRLHLHLSDNIATALNVGQRHGKPILLVVDARRMHNDGLLFYLSENKVWLTEDIDPQYLSEYKESKQ